MLVTNTAFWNGLPRDVRTELEQILSQVSLEVNRLAVQQSESAHQKIVAAGKARIHRLTKVERARWCAVLAPTWQQFETVIDRGLVEAAIQAGDSGCVEHATGN